MAPTPGPLPGKSHGWRSLVGCSPWDCEKSDTTEWLHFHFSCIGERNGNPIQCSCLENPRDEGAWWAAVSGVAQSWTGLKPLSSSSSSKYSTMQSSYLNSSSHSLGFPGGSDGKASARNAGDLGSIRETWVQSRDQEDPLEKKMAIHSSTLAWKIS